VSSPFGWRLVAAAALVGAGEARGQTHCPRASLPAYAHNDYRNVHPLTDALALGYRGAEADVFLVDGALRLGHERRTARSGATLEARYVAPLAALAERCGVWARDGVPFLLTVEFKVPSPAGLDSLVALLGRYPALAPAVDVVLVGWHPDPATLRAAPVRIGRHVRMQAPHPPERATVDGSVGLVSLDYGKTAGRWWVSPRDRRRWLAAIQASKQRYPDRRLRVHNVPVDGLVYATLLAAGADLIGTTSLATSARLLPVSRVVRGTGHEGR
jgi:hypothetical protein